MSSTKSKNYHMQSNHRSPLNLINAPTWPEKSSSHSYSRHRKQWCQGSIPCAVKPNSNVYGATTNTIWVYSIRTLARAPIGCLRVKFSDRRTMIGVKIWGRLHSATRTRKLSGSCTHSCPLSVHSPSRESTHTTAPSRDCTCLSPKCGICAK